LILAQEKTGYYGMSMEKPGRKRAIRLKDLTRGGRIALTGMVLAGFLLSVLIIYSHSQVSNLGYQISRLEKELALLRVENHDLEGEVQRLASLDRIERIAVERLGMVKPDSDNVLIVELAGKNVKESVDIPEQGNAVALSSTGEEKQNRLIRAFTEMVNRLENKTWLGLGGRAGSTGGTHADDEYRNQEKNNRSFSVGDPGAGRSGIPSGQDFAVVVDYAHTPDGLENILKTAREIAGGRLITVFGCGGDRDRTKRPQMGAIAARYSDFAVITSDNPRTEEPLAIIRDIEQGLKFGPSGEKYCVEPDRRQAIHLAIGMAGTGDVVVIAGKGHEDYQIVGTQRFPFDDRLEAAEALKKRES
jgi:cell division protein FtsL